MKYWITKKGNKLLVKEMSTSHILNCIAMLERMLAEQPEPFACESDSDGAYWANVSADRQNEIMAEDIKEAIDSFEKELITREVSPLALARLDSARLARRGNPSHS